jgi:hypothetical protein
MVWQWPCAQQKKNENYKEHLFSGITAPNDKEIPPTLRSSWGVLVCGILLAMAASDITTVCRLFGPKYGNVERFDGCEDLQNSVMPKACNVSTQAPKRTTFRPRKTPCTRPKFVLAQTTGPEGLKWDSENRKVTVSWH